MITNQFTEIIHLKSTKLKKLSMLKMMKTELYGQCLKLKDNYISSRHLMKFKSV